MTGALTARTAMVHVEGEWLAKHARTLVLEGKWARALKLLTDCLAGMTYETAISILKGEADLTGWATDEAGLQVKPLSPEGPIAQAMLEGLKHLYVTTFPYQNECWRPYAKVTSWSEADLKGAPEVTPENIIDEGSGQSGVPCGKTASRSLYYANSASSDLLVIAALSSTEDVAVLCEKTATPPLWFDLPADLPIERVRSLLAQGLVLEERGASVREEGLLPSVLRENAQAEPKPAASPVNPSKDREDRRERARRIASIRAQVRYQAERCGGYYRLALIEKDGETPKRHLSVPRNPFLLWALAGFAFEKFGKERPQWRIVSPTGLKRTFDDPYQTDWILGAGLSLEDGGIGTPGAHLAAAVKASALAEREALVRDWTGVPCSTLAVGARTRFCGVPVVARPYQSVPPGCIALAANAGAEYLLAMKSACTKDRQGSAGLILCASGEKNSPLVLAAREFSNTVVLAQEAVERFRGARALSIDLEEGKIYHVPGR